MKKGKIIGCIMSVLGCIMISEKLGTVTGMGINFMIWGAIIFNTKE